ESLLRCVRFDRLSNPSLIPCSCSERGFRTLPIKTGSSRGFIFGSLSALGYSLRHRHSRFLLSCRARFLPPAALNGSIGTGDRQLRMATMKGGEGYGSGVWRLASND